MSRAEEVIEKTLKKLFTDPGVIVVKIQELAAHFDVPQSVIRKDIQNGELQVIRIGNRIQRISRRDLESFLRRRNGLPPHPDSEDRLTLRPPAVSP